MGYAQRMNCQTWVHLLVILQMFEDFNSGNLQNNSIDQLRLLQNFRSIDKKIQSTRKIAKSFVHLKLEYNVIIVDYFRYIML